MSSTVDERPGIVAVVRARLAQIALASCAIYLALLPTPDGTFIRSWTFGLASLCAILLALTARNVGVPSTPSPGRAIVVTFGLWMTWSTASWLWTIRPSYTLGQLEREVLQTALIVFAFYVTCSDQRSFRLLAGVALSSFAFFAGLALGMAFSPFGWQPSHWHYDFGIWSTYVVLIEPFILLLLIPRPFGYADGGRSYAVAALMFALLIATVRITDNRIVWLALGVVLLTAGAAIATRFRAMRGRAVIRWFLPIAIVLIGLSASFIDVARERAARDGAAVGSLLGAFAADPRIALWERVGGKIESRPLLGYGFGRRILEQELVPETQNQLMNHAHNLFLSAAIQSGLIGLALFCAALVALVANYVTFLRAAGDRELALLGILGLALITGFVTKNLTDDFFYRSNAKEFYVLNAMVIGYGTRLKRRPR